MHDEPDRTDDLLERVSSMRTVWEAARRAARGKHDRAGVARCLFDLEGVVLGLHRALRDGSWVPGRPSCHVIHDPKTRSIVAAPFEVRIVHHAICRHIGPLLDHHIIPRSYACRTGLGTHRALAQAVAWARSYRFALHLDVRKYFPSVDHRILVAQLDHDLRCPPVVELCVRILDAGVRHIDPVRAHFPGDELFTPFERKVGLPIGNLTSQHFANRYLSPVDHRATDRLRIRAYLRYMDDMLLFANDRAQLSEWGHAIEEACWRQRLRLHPWQITPTRSGVAFLGFVILPHQVRVRRTSVARARRRLARLAALARQDRSATPAMLASMRSTFAHWAHGDTWRLREDTLRELGLLYEDDQEV